MPLGSWTEANGGLRIFITCDSTSNLAFDFRVGWSSVTKMIDDVCQGNIEEYKMST